MRPTRAAYDGAVVKAMTLRTQLVLLQLVIVLATVVTAGIAALWMQNEQLREASQARMIAVARSVAQLPTIIDAYDDAAPSAVIQPIAELIRDASDVTYIVVTDDEGIRYSHPDPDRIGEMVSTDPSVALAGEMYVGTQTGTLGESWRVKVPVHADDGDVIGQVSVGILEADLRADFLQDAWLFALVLGIATAVAVIAAAGVAHLVRRRIYGLEPDEIRGLLETRDATLHGIREGLIAFDEHGRVSLCNDAAARLLGLSSPEDVVGRDRADLGDADLVALADEAATTGGETPQRLLLAGERVLVARATPVRVHGRDAGAAVIVMDRTELDHALRELAGAQSAAEGLRAQQHEFANTLHTIGGLLDLGETDAARRMVDSASDGGPLTRAEPRGGVADPELTALLLAKRARARELGIDLDTADDLAVPAGAVDASDLVTIVGNLIDNAFDAAGAGGRVDVAVREARGSVEIVVEDDGPGVPAAERERVFALGFSTKSQGAPRGYGLTLVARVAERLGGRADVEPRPGGGARFVVRVPVQAAIGAGA